MLPYLIVDAMKTRYLDYMKQFWQENEIQRFSAKEVQLYFFFLAECNRQYWRNPFGCSTLRITNTLGISRQTLCRVRQNLQERGLITYKEGKNDSAIPSYTLLIKPDGQIASNVTADGTQNGTANGTQDGTIIKTYKTEDNISIYNSELLPLDKLQNLLSTDREWFNRVREYTNKQKIVLDIDRIEAQLKEFFLYLGTTGAQSKSIADTQRYFVNWLVKKESHKGYKFKLQSPHQVGVKLTDDNPDKFKDITGW